ncbi:MAG: hypothetical protein WDW36_006159 [Sanguina aurantia]
MQVSCLQALVTLLNSAHSAGFQFPAQAQAAPTHTAGKSESVSQQTAGSSSPRRTVFLPEGSLNVDSKREPVPDAVAVAAAVTAAAAAAAAAVRLAAHDPQDPDLASPSARTLRSSCPTPCTSPACQLSDWQLIHTSTPDSDSTSSEGVDQSVPLWIPRQALLDTSLMCISSRNLLVKAAGARLLSTLASQGCLGACLCQPPTLSGTAVCIDSMTACQHAAVGTILRAVGLTVTDRCATRLPPEVGCAESHAPTAHTRSENVLVDDLDCLNESLEPAADATVAAAAAAAGAGAAAAATQEARGASLNSGFSIVQCTSTRVGVCEARPRASAAAVHDLSEASRMLLCEVACALCNSQQGRGVLHRIRAGQLLLLLAQELWPQEPLPSSHAPAGPGLATRPTARVRASRSLGRTDVKSAVLEALALLAAQPAGMQLLMDQATSTG